jgi:FKBP-type peptidyl-prolyl cis-trans isomerase 2
MSKKKSQSKPTRFQKYKGAFSNFRQRFPKWKLFTLATIAVIGIIIVLTIMLWPSNAATTARNGDTVKIAYIGTYDNSSVFDSANSSAPLQFTIGNSSMIPGFVKGVIGMSVNETKKIRVAPEEGYGPSEFVEDINDLPSDVAVGQRYFLIEKPTIEVVVLYVNKSTVTLQNLNEMAGKYLNFEITLVELIKAE